MTEIHAIVGLYGAVLEDLALYKDEELAKTKKRDMMKEYGITERDMVNGHVPNTVHHWVLDGDGGKIGPQLLRIMSDKDKVKIYVRGGVTDYEIIPKDAPIKVQLIDYDNLDAEGSGYCPHCEDIIDLEDFKSYGKGADICSVCDYAGRGNKED